MNDPAVIVAWITAGGGALGGLMLLLRRILPARRSTPMTDVWKELRQLRTDLGNQDTKIDNLSNERDELRTTARIMSDAYDALTAAVSRTIPPIVFTAGERDAIDRAKARRQNDDHMWPTQNNPE